MQKTNADSRGGLHIPMPRYSETSAADQAVTNAMRKALRTVRTATSPAPASPTELERQRRGQKVLGRLASPSLGLSWEPFDLDGMPAAWVRPERGHDPRKVVLYCHGGGYTSGSLDYSRVLASKIANRTGYEVLCFEYRLAPEHPYPAARQDAMKAWDYLMFQGYGARDVVLLGDSAGGNLALVLTLMLRDAHRQLPRRLVLFSPRPDMPLGGESYARCAHSDPSLTADYMQATRDAYAPGLDWKDPLLSPVFGDFTGFPPVMIQVGSQEILFDDSARLHENLLAQGIPCRMECWEDMWHVFQMFPLKQSERAICHVADFLLEMF